MPPVPYIRESNRLVGEYTLTGADIRREKQGGMAIYGFTDAIAVGDYADDLHGCNVAQDFDATIENVANRPPGFRSGPFEIPLRALIPEKVDGLLGAEKNISESRLANGATRLQPITMLTGQAAGALAALAVQQGVPPRAIEAEQVQRVLLAAGSILARQPMPDLAQGTRPWQAAQFAVTHQWIAMRASGFAPNQKLTRAQAAEILTQAFVLNGALPLRYEQSDVEKHLELRRKESTLRPSFTDVPLYHEYSAAVEAWHATGLVPACKKSAALFCPDAPIKTAEFMEAVQALYEQKHAGKHLDEDQLGEDVRTQDDGTLTRIQAALILYNAGL